MRDAVDASWAEAFGLGIRDLRRPGTRLVVDAPFLEGYPGVYLLRIGDTCIVGAPAARSGRVTELLRDRGPDDIFSTASAAQLGDEDWVVLGPSRHHYVDGATFRPVELNDVRRLGRGDAEAIARLRAGVSPDEWREAGFDPIPAVVWGAFVDGALAALGNMTDWAGAPTDVGVVTDPRKRSRGLAKQLVSEMVADALRVSPVVRYRALVTNEPSLRVALRLGFVAHGENIAVRPPRPAASRGAQ